jgi:hypothetical protein
MKLGGLKEYIRKKATPTVEDIDSFLTDELMATLRELRAAFNRINFEDNFNCFVTDVSISAASEVGVPNKIDTIPRYWITVKKDQGGIYVCDGDTQSTLKTIYLKNTSATLSATVKIAFFK